MSGRIRALVTRLKPLFLALLVNVVLLCAVDWVLVKIDVLAPPLELGIPELGFGRRGFRRSAHYGEPDMPALRGGWNVAMVGDSHSELIFKNPLHSHEFVLESRLRAEGYPVNIISAGRGKYSPLQEYLLFDHEIKAVYKPRVLLVNFYSGNDFYDMLRPDDRPHFARDEDGSIVLRPPRWISFVNPESRVWIQRSRLLWGIDELASRMGLPRVITRLRAANAVAEGTNGSPVDTMRYLGNLRRSQDARLDYPAAFAAQILNQALFFRHFPESTGESIAFIRHLLERVRAENPGTMLVLAAIPSAALVNEIPRDVQAPWQDTLQRTGLTQEWVARVESQLVDELHSALTATGWLFVDLRECLRRHAAGHGELYQSTDLHISVVASRMIGECQAESIMASDEFKLVAHRSIQSAVDSH